MSIGQPSLLLADAPVRPAAADAAGRAAGQAAPWPVDTGSPWRILRVRLMGDPAARTALLVIALMAACGIFAGVVCSLLGAPGPGSRDPSALTPLGTPAGPGTRALLPLIVLLAGPTAAVAATVLLPRGRALRRIAPALVSAGALAAIVLAAIDWPSVHHLFGVDFGGRDVFSRVLYGERTALAVAFGGSALAVVAGLALGLAATASAGGGVLVARAGAANSVRTAAAIPARVVARAAAGLASGLVAVLVGFPGLLLALGVGFACSRAGGCAGGVHPGIGEMILVVGIAGCGPVGRAVRDRTTALREATFVASTRAAGASAARVLAREIAPNLAVTLVVWAALLLPAGVLLESALAFLGAGVGLGSVSWGSMLADASTSYSSAWWYVVFPGAVLTITVLALTVLGDRVRHAAGPT
jgi:peptide/nickel transport system permease protein